MSEQKIFRCAVYTRKSSEEGLEQDFNSLEAQREACEAYIRSQSHEGWKLIPERFDDGGFSGGNMDRPALGKLMSLVRDGKVDVIIIYKIDRLTRSLTDFARLAETFDKHGVSFVSVTQQFNTTTSMGRLMLNVLLSFAQFEREITGERIRDKIAASKKKGMWMGGPIPMGYDVKDRQLVVNDEHAKTIRRIFEIYLDEGNVPALLERLGRERIRTAPRISAKGKTTGSRPFTRGHVYKLLSNPVYIGRVSHKGKTHPGQHKPIVDQKTWDAVQAGLAHNTQGERKRRSRASTSTHLLAGLLYSQSGNRMIPAHATKSGRRYSYYVEELSGSGPASRETSAAATCLVDPLSSQEPDVAAAFTGANRPTTLRLPTKEIDAAVTTALSELLSDQRRLVQHLGEMAPGEINRAFAAVITLAGKTDKDCIALRALVQRAVVSQRTLVVDVNSYALRRLLGLGASERGVATDGPPESIVMPLTFRRRGRQLALAMNNASAGVVNNVDATLVTAIARAIDWFERLSNGGARSISDVATADGFDAAYVSHVLPLAFMAPADVEQIVAGQQRADLTADQLIWRENIAMAWKP